jgi:hypothetical protein
MFPLQVNNKPHDEVAIHAIILGADVVMNKGNYSWKGDLTGYP